MYAEKYAFSQNPVFASFMGFGGNCTNFVSQSIYAGACQMNETPTFGWYYKSLDDRSPSWTGVEYFYNFMVNNRGVGPFGEESTADRIEVGDVIQLGREGEGYYHSLLVVGFEGEEILVATQTDDVFRRPLSTYIYDFARFIKILGVRIEVADTADCFESVYNGEAILPGTDLPPMEE